MIEIYQTIVPFFLIFFLVLPITLSRALKLTPSLLAASLVTPLAVSSVLIQFTDFFNHQWTRDQIYGTLITASVIQFYILKNRASRLQTNIYEKNRYAAVLIPFTVSALFIVLGRLTASKQPTNSITTLAYIATKEDNAKWLNIASQITSGRQIAVGGVGAIIVCALAVSHALVQVVSILLSFKTTGTSLAIDTVMFCHLALVPVTALAYLPSINNDRRQIWRVLPAIFVVQILLTRTIGIGHLSLALTIVFLICAVLGLSNQEPFTQEWLLWIFLIQCGISIWLGILPLLILTPILVVIFYIRGNRLGKSISKNLVGVLLSCVPITLVFGNFQYVTHKSGTLNSLISASGGTLEASNNFFYVILFLLVLILLSKPETNGPRTAITFALICVTYLSTLEIWDGLRTGTLDYGSKKLAFLVSALLLAILIPIASDSFCNFNQLYRLSHSRIIFIAILILAFHADGFMNQSLGIYKNQNWPSAYSKEDVSWIGIGSGNGQSGGRISEIPIACAIKQDRGEITINYDTYLCTRNLIGLAGLEKEANSLMEWQLTNNWDATYRILTQLGEDVLSRKVILRNVKDELIGQTTLRTMIYSAVPIGLQSRWPN